MSLVSMYNFCSNVFHRCELVEEEECETVMDTVCKMETLVQCDAVEKAACTTIREPVCVVNTDQNCKEVPERECTLVSDVECRQATETK